MSHKEDLTLTGSSTCKGNDTKAKKTERRTDFNCIKIICYEEVKAGCALGRGYLVVVTMANCLCVSHVDPWLLSSSTISYKMLAKSQVPYDKLEVSKWDSTNWS